MKSITHPSQTRGTTLIEQLMVLSIMAALTSLAVPPLRQLVSRDRLQIAQTDFMAALQHARATAATSGMRTVLCPSRDGINCSDEGHWGHGWLMGHDNNHDDQPDNGPLYVNSGYQNHLTIHSSSGRHLVRFRPDGSAGGSNLTVIFCEPTHTAHTLTVVVSNSGRIRGAPGTAEQQASCAAAAP